MNVAIRAYSIDVAPERSSRRTAGAERIRSVIIAIRGRMIALLERKTASSPSESRCRNTARHGQISWFRTILDADPIA
jgi:hypothetical protein